MVLWGEWGVGTRGGSGADAPGGEQGRKLDATLGEHSLGVAHEACFEGFMVPCVCTVSD